MRRRAFIALLGGALGARFPARAEPSAVPTIGWVSSTSPAISGDFLGAFHDGLKQAGYGEGKNCHIEYRWADGHFERLPTLIDELLQRRVAVLVAGGPPAAAAAKRATATVPIVFVAGPAVEQGLVASLSHPGGNATGASATGAELWPKRVQLGVELVPQAATIAALLEAQQRQGPELDEARAAAQALGRDVVLVTAATAGDIERAVAAAVERGAGVLLVSANPLLTNARSAIVALAARHQLPAIYPWPDYVRAGGLASYGSSLTDAWHQAGLYAGRILRGEKPADLPVQEDTRIELRINLKTAAALGLTVPPAVLLRADEVIE